MKILSISDRQEAAILRNDVGETFADVDLVLSCGDLPPEYLIQLAARLQVPLYYVRGNHDLRYDSKALYGCTDLHSRIVRVQGIRMMGLEGSRWYNGGPFQYTDYEMGLKILGLWPRIWFNGGIDLVIAHAPPRHIHDAEDLCHQGFRSFRWLIRLFAPSYFIHGHIHAQFDDPSQRLTKVGRTCVVNTYGYYQFDPEEDCGVR